MVIPGAGDLHYALGLPILWRSFGRDGPALQTAGGRRAAAARAAFQDELKIVWSKKWPVRITGDGSLNQGGANTQELGIMMLKIVEAQVIDPVSIAVAQWTPSFDV